MGLSIARQLVRAMGGDLAYSDAFPRGARFTFTLPLAQSPEAAESVQKTA